MKDVINSIELKHFYASGGSLEAHGNNRNLIIDVNTELIRDEYYSPETMEHIREENGWENNPKWIRDYFLNNIKDIEIIEL